MLWIRRNAALRKWSEASELPNRTPAAVWQGSSEPRSRDRETNYGFDDNGHHAGVVVSRPMGIPASGDSQFLNGATAIKRRGCTRLLWERGFSKAIQLVAMHYEVTFSLCRKVSYISRVHGRSTNLVADSSSIRPGLKIIGFPTHCLRTRGCNLPYDSYNASHSERS